MNAYNRMVFVQSSSLEEQGTALLVTKVITSGLGVLVEIFSKCEETISREVADEILDVVAVVLDLTVLLARDE